MNYKKLLLVGFISAFVAILTSFLGVAGTVIGSVISSVLYNMLSEALEDPVTKANINTDFEWEIAYVFPLVVIALIQLVLIFALLAEFGLLPQAFVNFYLVIQNVANNNLYRILGFALLIISAYPLVLKPDFVKKEHGLILVFVGLIFLARGFVDLGNPITNLYDTIFRHFDLPIAIVAFVLLSFVIIRILNLSNKSKNKQVPVQQIPVHTQKRYKPRQDNYVHVNHDSNVRRHPSRGDNYPMDNHVRSRTNYNNHSRNVSRNLDSHRSVPRDNPQRPSNVRVNDNNKHPINSKSRKHINESSDDIQFESIDLLDDYKK